MSVRIGKQSGFSIEFEFSTRVLAAPDERRWLFGHLCFWAADRRLGDYESVATLSVALELLPDLVAYRGKRNDERLFGASASEAFETIFAALSVDSGQPDEQVLRDHEFYSRFGALPRGLDIFDGWDAFLIDGESESRLLSRARGASVIEELRFARGEFDDVIQQVINALQTEFDARKAVATRG